MAQVAQRGGTVTYTLLGRWQTRFFAYATGGVLVSFVLGFLTKNLRPILLILLALFVLGLLWDVLYTGLQKIRWNRDWSGTFQFLAGIFEGVVFWNIMTRAAEAELPIPGFVQSISEREYILVYVLIFLATFFLVQGPLRILFPRWRFNGGRII
jgi:hypothetical protein